MATVKISVPSVAVEGLCLVQSGDNVSLFARTATGDLEGAPAMVFLNDGTGIRFWRDTLASISVFKKDENGHIVADN